MKLEVIEAKAAGSSKGTILFVHGALHGAWCWTHFMEYFPKQGYDCYAMSFRGHGTSEGRERINEFGLDDYVEDLKQTLAKLPADAVVVAHSLGGMVLQRYLGDNPGTVGKAVFLASMPVDGTGPARQIKVLFRHFKGSSIMLKVNKGENVPVSVLKDAVVFGGRISEEELEPYASKIIAESTRIAQEQTKPATDKFDIKVPVRIIGSRGDWMFPDQSPNERAYGVKAVMLDDLCHDMMLDPEWMIAAKAVQDAIEG